MYSREQKRCLRSGKCHHQNDLEEGRHVIHYQVQTYKPTLVYIQIIHENSKE